MLYLMSKEDYEAKFDYLVFLTMIQLTMKIVLKSLGGTNILSFNEVFNSLLLCFVYLVLFYKPF
jgi:hypothetical protein